MNLPGEVAVGELYPQLVSGFPATRWSHLKMESGYPKLNKGITQFYDTTDN